jgi:tellurite resistance protein TehA-like permease
VLGSRLAADGHSGAAASLLIVASAAWLLLNYGIPAMLITRPGAEPSLWSMVFPVGMYGVASRELGKARHVSWLATLGSDEAWLALAVWAVVFLAMLGSFLAPLRNPARRPARPPPPAVRGGQVDRS